MTAHSKRGWQDRHLTSLWQSDTSASLCGRQFGAQVRKGLCARREIQPISRCRRYPFALRVLPTGSCQASNPSFRQCGLASFRQAVRPYRQETDRSCATGRRPLCRPLRISGISLRSGWCTAGSYLTTFRMLGCGCPKWCSHAAYSEREHCKSASKTDRAHGQALPDLSEISRRMRGKNAQSSEGLLSC